MTKYDYGYNIETNSSFDRARKAIAPGSTVLDIGSSVGILAKLLTETLACTVDIVEFDAESGARALQYARFGAIGPKFGDIRNRALDSRFSPGAYDAVVLLDVLEHLHNPQEVLRYVRRFLKPGGQLIISLPNIAHNAILIDLYNNRFQYTPTGLLDNTHLYFFTAESAVQMLRQCGYWVATSQEMRNNVEDTELKNSYNDVPAPMAAMLKTRPLGNLYQMFFVCRAAEKGGEYEEHNVFASSAGKAPFAPHLYVRAVQGGEYSLEDFAPETAFPSVSFSVPIGGGSYAEVRIDPCETNCVLKNLQITDGKGKALPYICPSAIVAGELLFFFTEDPVIIVTQENLPEDALHCSYTFVTWADPVLKTISAEWDSVAKQMAEYTGAANETRRLQAELLALQAEHSRVQNALQSLLTSQKEVATSEREAAKPEEAPLASKPETEHSL